MQLSYKKTVEVAYLFDVGKGKVAIIGYFGIGGTESLLGQMGGQTKQMKSIMSELIPQEKNAIFLLKSLAVRTTGRTMFATKNGIILRLFSLKAPKQ